MYHLILGALNVENGLVTMMLICARSVILHVGVAKNAVNHMKMYLEQYIVGAGMTVNEPKAK